MMVRLQARRQDSGRTLNCTVLPMNGNIRAVKLHLAAGADVNAKDGRGDTPLDKDSFDLMPKEAQGNRRTAD